MKVLAHLGLKARAPVDPMSFADPMQREKWVAEKGLQVFALYSPSNPLLALDLFARDPVPFEELWKRAEIVSLEKTEVRIASIDDLLAMKRSAGRPQDLLDIEALEALKRARNERRNG